MIYFKIVVGILLIFFICRSYWETKHFVVKEYKLCQKNNKLKGEKIAFISDLHSCLFGTNQDRLIEAIDNINPTIVCIGGDLIIGKKRGIYDNALMLLKRLAARGRVYYSFGNHEGRLDCHSEDNWFGQYLKDIDEINKEFNGNIVILKDEGISLENDICLLGLNIDQLYYKKLKNQDMTTDYVAGKLGSLDTDKYNILMAHHPKYMKAYMDYGYDLILAGHYHGGMVRLPKLGGIVGTDYSVFPKNDKGIYWSKGQAMIVSGGLGGHTFNIRLFNIPELVVVTFGEDDKKDLK